MTEKINIMLATLRTFYFQETVKIGTDRSCNDAGVEMQLFGLD
jgi:hypothetical protein